MKSKTDALIFALVLVIANYKPINGIALDCLYEVRSFPYIDANVYTCVGKVLFDATVNENVTWVYGVHETGKGNGDVHGIVLREQNLEFIPTNIEQFFQNIIVIDLADNIITSVSNRHLTPFPNLQYLSFIRNEITSLDGDLFAGINAMNMKLISFTANDVRHVGHDLNLPLNGAISFTDNPCISQTAFTPDEVASLKLNLLRSCPPTISQIEQSLESRQNLLTSIEWQVQGLIKTMDETRNDITSLRQDNTYLWGVVQELYNRVAELEAIIGGQGDHKSVVQFLNDSSGNNELTNRP